MGPHGRKSPGRKAETADRWPPHEKTRRVGVAAGEVLTRQPNDPHNEGTRPKCEVAPRSVCSPSHPSLAQGIGASVTLNHQKCARALFPAEKFDVIKPS